MDTFYGSQLSRLDVLPHVSLPSVVTCAGQDVIVKETSAVEKLASNTNQTSELCTKPKQSKSRNGCVTCKGKRLKCDETKPTCKQCHKRGVECGGYRKDFKWRAYEESTLAKTSKQLKKTGGGVTKTRKIPSPPSSGTLSPDTTHPMLHVSPSPFSSPFASPSSYEASPQYGCHLEIPLSDRSQFFDLEYGYTIPDDQRYSASPPALQHEDSHSNRTSPSTVETYTDINTSTTYPVSDFADLSSRDGLSPQALQHSILPSISLSAIFSPDDCIKGEIIDQRLESEASDAPIFLPQIKSIKEEDLEEQTNEGLYALPQFDPWPSSYPSPPLSDHCSSSSESYSTSQVLARPLNSEALSPEMLLFHFDKYTCGIMSVKNGLNDNPWRTLIWPLAQQTPALYHAIAAMTAFHISRDSQAYRFEGVEHVRQSLGALRDGIGNNTISDEGALATTLVLAFSEAFDSHICTGSHHLKGARALIKQALAKNGQNPQWGGLRCLKFLHNVWVYLDVLSRLTSDTGDDEVATSLLFGPHCSLEEIDPLMGCATTLFPIIGQVANLVRKIRQSTTNSLQDVNQAMKLKHQLKSWVPGTEFVPPEDRSMEVVHCLKTAEAYKYATLLYLHQAIPAISSGDSHWLAKKVLRLLASVPITSGACIVHIYPLLVAGCEATSSEERRWVQERWEQMSARMWIGNVDKAWQVVKEVWNRRDIYYQQKGFQARLNRSEMLFQQYPNSHPSRASSLPPGPSQDDQLPLDFTDAHQPVALFDEFGFPIDPRTRLQRPNVIRSSSEGAAEEYTGDMGSEISVNSSLHWVSVMKDWQWEVLLG